MAFARTNGIDTYYERRGEGPPVVFVHGAVLDHGQWDRQTEALRDDYTTISYDIRGHGRTGGSEPATYSMELFADDLAALVSELDLDRPVVCGLSTGGCVAQAYAMRYPDRLSGLVLADTFSPVVFDRLERFQRLVVPRLTIPFVRLVGYERVEKVMVWFQERLSGTPAGGDYGNVERLRERGPPMATDEFAKVIRAVSRFTDSSVVLGDIDVPTLVLYGENELPFVRRHAAAFGDGIPTVTVRSVPGAGHASNLDNPAFFEDALREFLDGLRTVAR
ncbi:alpha/beta hydrolase fold protein / chloride peroxidase [Haloferax gibbonsii ATCC 33959]|uniref:Alpha/beta hydrolase fold protein / chloride peroxidase n=1 Tax=Haloferax gibbonsii (strain ATCC 33959 / DSM 4427 / JCM 8863 / NBRC 102184 / NCIMB 2188 / Ma 2.38) TaxID=1227459 RepID=M0GWI8_HALGM|nr:alpha/beta hydrolase [Haloferax gibbonsii]ELZ75938.1 alpha/beta hydrolase fold protein / chloride peroxidase [Haloferax gibbonsii ATCC 33959]